MIAPPSWFVGMSDNIPNLFVYGKDLIGISVTSSISNDIQIVANGERYIILNISLSQDIDEGVYNLKFKKGDVVIIKEYALTKKSKRRQRSLTPAGTIYLIMPDRFARGKDTTGESLHVNRSKANYWHGGNINGVREHLDYIQDLGVTTVWLTPIFKNNSHLDKGKYASYHGYAITDFYDVDPHFGTITDYRQFVKAAHDRNLKVVMDVVFNHCGSEHPWNHGCSPHSWINQNNEKTNYECTTVFDSYVSTYDRKRTVKGYFADIMPDLNLGNGTMLKYLTQMTFWWIETADIDAIRMDTFLYSDNRQMKKWLKKLKVEYPHFPVIAETWIGNPAYTAKVQKEDLSATGKENPLIVMDFAFQECLLECFDKEDLPPLYDHFVYVFLYSSPLQTLIFLDNHDMTRWMRKHSNLEDEKLAMAILLTMPRIPQLFYGTEMLFSGEGDGKGDGKIRQDFYIDGDRNLFLPSKRSEVENEFLEYTKKLLHWRMRSTVVPKGSMKHYLSQNGVYVYFRKSKDSTIMVLVNPTKKSQPIDLSRYAEDLREYTVGTDILTGKDFELGVAERNDLELDKKEVLLL